MTPNSTQVPAYAVPPSLAGSVISRLQGRLRAAMIGRDDVIDLIIIALLADGHVLLEDFPGSGKTTLAKALGDSIIEEASDSHIAGFRRIQFTPDLLPSDITGVSIFDAGTGSFTFRPGPLFACVVLADEINRTSPKVQSAMLEAMAEKQVTVDNVSRRLNDLFFVIATQNPREVAGTYPLPLPQLDRFLFKIRMDYIDRGSELRVLETRGARMHDPGIPLVHRSEVLEARVAIQNHVYINPAINDCLVDTARALRTHPKVAQGVSTRCLVLMLPALQVSAALHGRDFVAPEDVERLGPFVFSHRLELRPGARDPEAVVRECIAGPLDHLTRYTLQQRT
ncbi:MAG: MoxR family ATPase [Acidobacteriaceae bacterium]|nr:MoxR family ATPase [Acidobacteriaceae bacterium]